MDVFRPDDYDLNRFRWARFTNALDGTSIPVVGHVRHVLFYGEEVACRIEYGVAPGLSRKCSVYGDRRILALEALSRKYRKLVHIAEKTIAEKNVPSPAYVLRITPQEWAMLRTRREYQDLVTWIREAGYELRLTSIDAKSMNVTVRPVSSQRGAVQCTTRIPIGDATELEVITLHAIEHTAR